MRPEELVRRADQEVRPQSGRVEGQVRRGVDGVHVRPGPDGVGHLDDPGDRVDGADRVGGQTDSHHPRAGAQRPFQAGNVERAVRLVDVDPANDGAAFFLQGQPWRHVGIVVQPRDDDLVARTAASARWLG